MMKDTKVKVVFVAIVLIAILAESSRPVYGANPDGIEVSVATGKKKYLLGEEVVINITAYNPNPKPVSFGFKNSLMATYLIDGIFDWRNNKITSPVHTEMILGPHSYRTWKLRYGPEEMEIQPLKAGTHTVKGIVGYTPSEQVNFEVISEAELSDTPYSPDELIVRFAQKEVYWFSVNWTNHFYN